MKTTSASRPRKAQHAPLKLKQDYVTFTLDVINERFKVGASSLYERECGVTLREVRLLRFIGSEPGLTLSRLIEQAYLEKTLASKAVTALVRRGLVVRSIGTEDARQINLHLTDEGVDIVLKAEPLGRFAETTFRSALTAEERESLDRCLQKLADFGEEFEVRIGRHLQRTKARQEA
ncbi:MarR family winged helix-turn-helix transcriptional regulator [Variovorax sp. J22R133]|uniref:MarR family winged helix-turn-helix transcriptional regulator n=1 Tax=Variovorax brevis TaxID=3053503 RepID=UPI0025789B85|nr:MarR family winged helix-turn-helix transcriptional regulator [Variovorax sp. J22R133]MDM0112561.1 MarR family winged helix-turn-helix transcriptional regulator [Variovorax sp. J22R133]